MSAAPASSPARSRDVAALGHLAALVLLWRWAPGGLPTLCALAAVLAPVAARSERSRLAFAIIDVLVVIAGTLGEVLVARGAEAAETGLVAALARGFVLAAAAGARRATPAASGLLVIAPVGFALLCAGTLSGTTSVTDGIAALVAIGACVATAASAHHAGTDLAARANPSVAVGVREAAARPVAGVALVHAALTVAIFLAAVALGRDVGLAPPSPHGTAARARRPSIGLEPEIVFRDFGSPAPGELTTVGTVRVDGPPRSELFLRAAGLERADEDGFRRPGPAEATTEPTVARELERIESPRPVRLDVTLREVPGRYLVGVGSLRALDPPYARRDRAGSLVLLPGVEPPIRYVLEADEDTDGSDDRLQALDAVATAELVSLPASLRGDAALLALAEQLARGASTPHGRARAIERRLAGEWEYDLGRSRRTRGLAASVRRFLLEEKRGACTEFATAMAVLLRLSGVPARLAVGYHVDARGREADGSWTVNGSDAHAWVEVPLRGAGWVLYDPTAPTGGAAAASEPGPAALVDGPAPDAMRSMALGAALAVAAALGVALLVVHRLRERRSRRARLRPGADTLAPPLVSAVEALLLLVEEKGFTIGGPEPLLAFALRRDDPALVRAVRLYYAIRFSGREASPRLLRRLASRIASVRDGE